MLRAANHSAILVGGILRFFHYILNLRSEWRKLQFSSLNSLAPDHAPLAVCLPLR